MTLSTLDGAVRDTERRVTSWRWGQESGTLRGESLYGDGDKKLGKSWKARPSLSDRSSLRSHSVVGDVQ